LPAEVPVVMPEIPAQLLITASAQFKAAGDPLRSRVLAALQNGPATAKQLATRLGVTPGALGHHLHVLESAGLIQVVARRLVRGIVAKYYARTARLFLYDSGLRGEGEPNVSVRLISQARDELVEVVSAAAEGVQSVAFPHVRLTETRAIYYQERLTALLDEVLAEPPDPAGHLYGVCLALFKAPPSLQTGSS
jgi:DNA-binding transcriptional ArsR family regulator